MAWQEPKTDWLATDGIMADDLNRIEVNTKELANTDVKLAADIKTAKDRADEAFQSANDGKIGLASVIGEPSTKTFLELKNILQTAKEHMVANLRAKGDTTAVITNHIQNLADRIAILPAGGKKFATGTGTLAGPVGFNTWADGVTSLYYLFVGSMTFKPRALLVTDTSGMYVSLYFRDLPTAPLVSASYRILSRASASPSHKHDDVIPGGNMVFENTYFQVPVAKSGGGVTWYAWE